MDRDLALPGFFDHAVNGGSSALATIAQHDDSCESAAARLREKVVKRGRQVGTVSLRRLRCQALERLGVGGALDALGAISKLPQFDAMASSELLQRVA